MSSLFPVRVTCMLKGCPSCGGSFPINGLVSETTCPSCQEAIPLPEEVWAEAFDGIDADTLCAEGAAGSKDAAAFSGGYELHLEWSRVDAPSCLGCGAPLAVPASTSAPQRQSCSGCHEVAELYPPPFEVPFGGPPIGLVLAPERDAPPGVPPVPTAEKGGGAAPVVMSCPKCGGALELDSESTRTVPCSYCGAAVFLPDELWRTLHPVKRAVPWTAVFQLTRASLDHAAKGHWGCAIPIVIAVIIATGSGVLAHYQTTVRGFDFGFYLFVVIGAVAVVAAVVGLFHLLGTLRGYSKRAAELDDPHS